MGTHFLLRAEEERIQDTDKNRASKGALTSCQVQRKREFRTPIKVERARGHSLPVEQGRNKSGMTPKETEQVRDTHTLWGVEGGTSQDTEMSKREVLTSCRAQMEQQVRILKETERARHSLPVARKGRCKSGHQRNRTSEGYSPRSKHRGSDKSGH